MSETIYIKELNPEIIPPLTGKFKDKNYNGGSKIVIIGKPGTGKSTLIKALLYSKRHIFPVGMAMSGSEDTNHAFAEICLVHLYITITTKIRLKIL